MHFSSESWELLPFGRRMIKTGRIAPTTTPGRDTMADYQLDHILRQLKNIADLLHDIRQQTAVPVAPRYTAEVNFRDLPTLQPQPPMFEGPDEDFDGHLPLGDPLTSPHRTARATRALLGLPEVDPLNDDPDDDLSRRARLYDDPPSDD